MSNEAQTIMDLLPYIADRTHAQLCELHKRPTAERADLAAASVNGIYTLLRKLSTALQREGDPQ